MTDDMTADPSHAPGASTAWRDRHLDPSAVRAGDIVFVFDNRNHSVAPRWKKAVWHTASHVTRWGQSALHWRYKGRWERTLYSHVILGLGPGLVIHADGESIKIQPARDVLAPTIAARPFSARRLAEPLSEDEASRLRAHAERYLNQRYSFIVGRRSQPFGRFLHGGRVLTLPFCSELIAASYSAIGRPITGGAPDMMLPLHLDQACRRADWIDVSQDYYEAPLRPDAAALYADIFHDLLDTDSLLDHEAALNAELSSLRQRAFTSLEGMTGVLLDLVAYDLSIARSDTSDPAAYLRDNRGGALEEIAALDDFYQMIVDDAEMLGNPGADTMANLFPAVEPADSPFEGHTRLDHLALRERSLNITLFGTKAMRLVAILAAVASATSPADSRENAIKGVDQRAVQDVLRALPALSPERAAQVLQGIERLEGREGLEQRLASLARSILKAHRLLASVSGPSQAG